MLLAAGIVAAMLVPAAPAHGAPTRYEAEDATISAGTADSDHGGYSGTGFANTDNADGVYVEWTVTAAGSGVASMTVRYSNGGTGDRPMDIRVDGVVVAAEVSFPPTAGWGSWATETITAEVSSGSHTIRATATTADGNPNLDYLEVEVTPAQSEYQAEEATLGQAVIASDHAGFTGSGFVDYDNATGSFVQWSVTTGSAGSTDLSIRYANGSTASRPMDISVNGAVVSSDVPFDPTGGWDSWAAKTVLVQLDAGTSTIRATAATSVGGPNVDRLDLGPADGDDGWIEYWPSFNVQERGCGQVDGLTFSLTCPDGDGDQRAERRYATYGGGSRKFDAYFTITSMGGSRVSLKQTFKTTGPYFMIAVENGGRLYAVHGGKTLFTGATVGTTVRLTTVHVVGESHKIYINGILRDTVSSPDGDFYDKFGAYRTNSGEGPITVRWSNVRFWHK